VQTIRPSTPGRPTLDTAEEYIRVLYYGDPGLMKTTCAASMAVNGRVIYIDSEHRLKATPLRRVATKIGLDPDFVSNIEVVTDCDYASLLELTNEIKDRISDGEQIYGVAWDSATEQTRGMLESLVDESVERAAFKGEQRNPVRLYQEDYGDMTEQFRRILHRLRDLPVHLAITALPRRDQDENKALRVAAGVTPAVLRDLQGAVDFILHMRYESFSEKEGDDEYTALCRPQGPFDAKDTFGVLPVRMVNPTFPRLLAYVRGELVAKADPLQIEARTRRLALAEHTKAEVKSIQDGDQEDTDAATR
jgi:hypothetical protein